MNITTKIINIGAGLAEDDSIAVLNFTVVATADSGETTSLDVSQVGGAHPPPATPRTAVKEPVMEPIMEPVMEPIMEPVYEVQTGEDGEPRKVQTGEQQVGERQVGETKIGERQVGEKIVGYEGGYTQGELMMIAETVADERNARAEAEAQLRASIPLPSPYTPLPVHEPNDDERKQMMAAQIDGTVAYIYSQFTRFQVEYELREAAARNFKAAGYTGTPDPLVADYAESSGMTNQQAADATIYMADQLRAALPQLGILRMRKNRVLRAATMDEARAEYQAIADDIEQIQRGLP